MKRYIQLKNNGVDAYPKILIPISQFSLTGNSVAIGSGNTIIYNKTDHSSGTDFFTLSNGVITLKRKGVVKISTQIWFNSNGGAGRPWVQIWKDSIVIGESIDDNSSDYVSLLSETITEVEVGQKISTTIFYLGTGGILNGGSGRNVGTKIIIEYLDW